MLWWVIPFVVCVWHITLIPTWFVCLLVFFVSCVISVFKLINLFVTNKKKNNWNYVLINVSFVMQMIDDQDLGFFANFLGIFIFVLVIAYHYVMADPKFEGN